MLPFFMEALVPSISGMALQHPSRGNFTLEINGNFYEVEFSLWCMEGVMLFNEKI